MRVATWAIQEQERLCRRTRSKLGTLPAMAGFDERLRRSAVDAGFRLMVARLSGAGVHPRTVSELRAEIGTRALAAAVRTLAGIMASDGRDGDQAEVERAQHEVETLLGFSTAHQRPSDDVARALDDVVAMEASPKAQPPPTALLRIRAKTAHAARALHQAAQTVLGTATVELSAHAPDELIVSARGALPDAVSLLVRTSTALLSGTLEADDFAAAIVTATEDPFGDAIRAAGLLGVPGLLSLDGECWDAASGSLAEVPGVPRAVDPRGPYHHDRWELSALLQRPPFLGRDDDVDVVSTWLRSDVSGPALLLVHGPAGIGKSALVRAALADAGLLDDRAVVLWGAADPLQPTPYAAMVGMVRALARAPAGHPQAWHRLKRLVEGLAEALAPTHPAQGAELRAHLEILAYFLGTAPEEAHEEGLDLDAMSPRVLRVAVRRAFLLLVQGLLARTVDDRPAVFVVTGADAMDVPTRDALRFCARLLGNRARVILLSAGRLRLSPVLQSAFCVQRLELRPLAVSDARALCASLLDVTTDDPALSAAAAVLHEQARGSPLFVAHAVRFAVEGGLLQRRGERWDASRLDGERVPGRIDGLLQGRIARLPPMAQQVLGHCATLGLTFMPAAVEFVGVRLGLPREEVWRALQLLVETGFLSRSQRRPGAPAFEDGVCTADILAGNDELLVFEHPLLRAAAAAVLSRDEALDVHVAVAEALEALLDTRAVAPTLARHHRLANNRRQAVGHLVTAVRRASRLDDRQGAITMAQEGLRLCASHEHEALFTLQLELCTVLEDGGTREPLKDALKDALKALVRIADNMGEPRRQGQALVRIARFNLFLGDADKAEEAGLKGLERLRVANDLRGQALCQRLLALIRFSRRDLDGARRALEEARRLTAPKDHRALAIIEHQAGMMLVEQSDPIGALEHLLRAKGHKRACGDLAGEGACLDAIADVYVRKGRLETALSILQRALELRERIGDDAGYAQSLRNRADVLLLSGDVSGARDDGARARVLARQLGLDRLEHLASLIVARAELLGGDTAAAEKTIENVRRRVDRHRGSGPSALDLAAPLRTGGTDPFAAMEAELLSARVKWNRALLSSGPARDRLLKTAGLRARAAIEIGERHGYLSGQVLGCALMGDVLLAGGDAGGALPFSQRAAELLDDRSATALPVEEVLGTHVRALVVLGDIDEARLVAARARVLLEARARHLPPEAQERFWAAKARRAFLESEALAAQ